MTRRTPTPEAAAAETKRLRDLYHRAPHGLRSKRRARLQAAIATQLRAEVRSARARR